MTSYTLARFDYTRKTPIARVRSIDVAILKLYALGYKEVLFEEDAENPQHWDIFAMTANDADVYTVEPVKEG